MPADRFVLSHIRDLPLFARLPPEQLELVGTAFEIVRAPQGSILFQQGQPSQGVYVFTSGRGALTQAVAATAITPPGEMILAYTQLGQALNEVALFHETTETATLRVVEEAIVLFLSRRHMVGLVRAHPEIWTNLRVPAAPGTPSYDASAAPLLGTSENLRGADAPRQLARQLFVGQRVDESVIEIFRPHWWAFGRYLWIPGLVAVAGLIGTIALAAVDIVVGVGTAVFALAFITVIVGYLYVEWRNDSVVLSNQRVVRIWNTLFPMSRTINEIPLARVLEVNFEIPPADIFARLFEYGTVYVKTAGEAASFTLPLMHNPVRIQKLIFAEREGARAASERHDQEAMRREVEQAVGLTLTAAQSTPRSDVPIEHHDTAGPFFARTKFINGSGGVVYRHHISIWLVKVLPPLTFGLVALVVAVLALLWPGFPLYGGLGVFGGILGVMACAIWVYLADWDWRNDMFIISDDSIQLIHQRPLWLQNEVQQIRLAQVDNVVSDISGLLNNLLNRGDVRISLIGSGESKLIEKVYEATEVRAEISRRQAAFKARTETSAVNQQRQAVIDYLAAYHQTVQEQAPVPTAPPGYTFQPQLSVPPQFSASSPGAAAQESAQWSARPSGVQPSYAAPPYATAPVVNVLQAAPPPIYVTPVYSTLPAVPALPPALPPLSPTPPPAELPAELPAAQTPPNLPG